MTEDKDVYKFSTCMDISTLDFAHKMVLKPFSDEFQRNIAAIEQAHADRCYPHQEVYDNLTEEVRLKYVKEYEVQKKPLEEKMEKIRIAALRKIQAVEDHLEKVRLSIQKKHDTNPIIADATKVYKDATKLSDEIRDAEVEPFWQEYQNKIAPIYEEYVEREKQLEGGTKLKRFKTV